MSSSSSATPASEYTMATATAKFSHGFPALLGLEFLEWEEGRVVVGMQVDERHLIFSLFSLFLLLSFSFCLLLSLLSMLFPVA